MTETPIQREDERMKILRMIEEGKITAEQGIGLLSAVSAGQPVKISLDPEQPADPTTSKAPEAPQATAQPAPAEPIPESPRPTGTPRWFKVRVTDTATGRPKVSVTLPFGLVDWGLRIGARFAPETGDIDMDEVREALRSGIEGKIIDVVDEEDGEHVEIYVE